MFCTKCGNELAEGSKFCSACGANVASAEPSTPTGRQSDSVGSASSDGFRALQVIASVICTGSYFLPFLSIGIDSLSLTLSEYQLTFGIDVFGQHVDGNLGGVLLLIAPTICALAGIALSASHRRVVGLTASALALLLGYRAMFSGVAATLSTIVTPAFGFYVYVASAFVSSVACAWPLLTQRRG